MHPYKKLPADKFWRKHLNSIRSQTSQYACFEPGIDKSELSVMTFGSCFAENVIPYLYLNQIKYTKTEDTLHFFPSKMSEDKIGYSTFSCEYGNIYTPQQALQLFDELDIGLSRELISGWQVADDGSIVDLLRPGFPHRAITLEEFANRRKAHRLKCIEAVLGSSHIFITLGMAETWIDTTSGLALPACPGTIVGHFDASRFQFYEYTYEELLSSLTSLVKRLSRINPNIKVVLTVSPIPMIATASIDMTVLEANFFAKSKLINVAREVTRSQQFISYFPSYELITSDAFGNRSFSSDGRTVDRTVLDKIFGLMFATILQEPAKQLPSCPTISSQSVSTANNIGQLLANLECEEIALSRAE